MTMNEEVHVIVDGVRESELDAIVAACDPYKIVAFVPAEEEDENRVEYERIYHRFGDRITLYAGDVCLLLEAYFGKYPNGRFYDAGVLDAGVLDAGVLDAGVLDAGVLDAGH